jgi:hypothetical protein
MLILRCFTVFQKYPAKLALFSNKDFQKINIYKNPAKNAGSWFSVNRISDCGFLIADL